MKIRQWFSNGAGRSDAGALAGADGALSFDDWRDSLFPERDFMVKETHTRTGYPLPRYARVSHMTRLFPSREDEFRYALMQKLRPGEVAVVERSLSSPSPRERRKAAQDWFATVSEAIGALGLDDIVLVHDFARSEIDNNVARSVAEELLGVDEQDGIAATNFMRAVEDYLDIDPHLESIPTPDVASSPSSGSSPRARRPPGSRRATPTSTASSTTRAFSPRRSSPRTATSA